jgi:hypothetical protein
MRISIHCFSFTTFKVPENEGAQLIEGSEESLALVGLSKFLYE